MTWIKQLFSRRRIYGDLSAEIQEHLEERIEELIAEGMPRKEAEPTARREFGNATLIEEDGREAWRWQLIEGIVTDVSYALRTLRKSPGFTLTAILTLALGIGANTAIFQLLDAVRLRSLPVVTPEALAVIQIQGGNRGFGVSRYETQLTYPLWEQIRAHQEGFSSVFAWARAEGVRVGQGSGARPAKALRVSGETFSTLGLLPIRGRLLTAEDDHTGCGAPGAVISYSFWQSEFGGQDSAVGSKLIIEGQPVEILGVTGPNFFGLEVGKTFDFAVPLCMAIGLDPKDSVRRDYFWLTVMGRLKPGWLAERASAQLQTISPGLFETTVPQGVSTESQQRYRAFRLSAYPAANGVSELRKDYDVSLWLLLGITGLVLLIACANLANLMLVRAGSREREMAVRSALGAPRERLIRQTLSEGLILAGTGALLGVFLANVFSRAMVALVSPGADMLHLDLTLDWRVLAFTAAMALTTCMIFDVAPAYRSSRADPATALRSGSRGTTPGRKRFSFQGFLVVTQIATSVVLLVSALLFVRSFLNLITLDPGFREKDIVIAFLDLSELKLPAREYYESLQRDLLREIQSIPQVQSAATSTHIPLDGSSWTLGLHVNGMEGWSKFSWVTANYFQTMDIPLVAGRDLDNRATPASPRTVVVNQKFVREYFDRANPIGATLRTVTETDFPEAEYEIVGVVKDTKYAGLREEIQPQCFAAASQFPPVSDWSGVFIHSSLSPPALISAVREKIDRVNPEIKTNFSVFQKDIDHSLVREKMMALLSGIFGGLAALLTAIGLYGVISYVGATRRNEIGIRMALGASRANVGGIILRQMLVLLVIGIGIGVLLALAAGRAARSQLYGLQWNDPLIFAGAIGLSSAVALIASFIPARRAMRVDPMVALRYE